MEEKFVTFCFSQIAYQNKDDFETFLESLEFSFDLVREKDSLTMAVLGNFMAKSNLGILMTARILKDWKLTL